MLAYNNGNIPAEMWREACDRGTILHFKVVSGSMSPLVEVDDVVMVSKAEPSGIKVGDIVAFREENYVIVHRIIDKTFSNSQIKFRHVGDNGGIPRELVAEDIIGLVTAIRKGDREIRLDSRWNSISSRILVSRLKFIDSLGRMKYKHLGSVIRLILRPFWRINRRILLWR